MKNLLSTLAFTLCALLTFTGCTDEDNYYVENNIDLIIQQIQDMEFDDVMVYCQSKLVFSGPRSQIKGFEKPFIIFTETDLPSGYEVDDYYNLNNLESMSLSTYHGNFGAEKTLTLNFSEKNS